MTEFDGVRYEPTRLVIPTNLTLDEFVGLLRSLGGIARGHQWWVGDALVEGEKRYGEEIAQHAEELNLEPHTLTNWRWVADSIKSSRRREDLTWSHHAEVARLPAKDQTTALAKAAKESWTVRQLRDYVAITWPVPTQQRLEHDHDDRDDIADNRRLEAIERTIDTDGVAGIDESDVRWLLDIARRTIRG